MGRMDRGYCQPLYLIGASILGHLPHLPFVPRVRREGETESTEDAKQRTQHEEQRKKAMDTVGFHYQVTASEGGHDYTVSIENKATQLRCTCPDHKFRRTLCKHIFFILFRVLRLERTNEPPQPAMVLTSSIQRAWTQDTDLCRVLDARMEVRAPEAGAGVGASTAAQHGASRREYD
jgi:hypothetical protein